MNGTIVEQLMSTLKKVENQKKDRENELAKLTKGVNEKNKDIKDLK